MKKVWTSNVGVGGAVALVALLVYLSTLAPSIGSMDSGELAAVASSLGVAHPTGYPLFTLLGWAIAQLPFDGRVIWKLNLFSALLCAAAVFGFYRLFLELLTRPLPTRGNLQDTPRESTPLSSLDKTAAATAVLVLAFSRTFWLQALSVEVYALHLLFVSLLCLLFLKAMRDARSWALFAFVLGLSFTNHMTTILLAPGFLYLFFRQGGFSRFIAYHRGIKVVFVLACFLAGLSLYLYLPLRASQNPVLNWGDPSSLQRFWEHVSAKQFRPWMYSSFDSALMQFGRFVVRFPSEFGYLALAFAITGVMDLYRRNRTLLVFSLLLFFGCLFYSVNYSITDVDAYFLLAYIATAIWITFGVRALLTQAWKPSATGLRRFFATTLCVLAVLLPLCVHYHTVDQSDNFAEEDLARNMLQSLAPGAVILTDEETSFYFTAYYLQWVEGVRTDVVLLGYRALGMPWYLNQLEASYPWLIQNSKPEIEAFVHDKVLYDRGELTDQEAYAASFVRMVQSLLRESSKTHPVYISATVPQAYGEGFKVVPDGLALRLFRDSVPTETPAREFSYRPLPETPESEAVKAAYAWGYFNQAAYRIVSGDSVTGQKFLRKALAIDPNLPGAAAWLRKLN